MLTVRAPSCPGPVVGADGGVFFCFFFVRSFLKNVPRELWFDIFELLIKSHAGNLSSANVTLHSFELWTLITSDINSLCESGWYICLYAHVWEPIRDDDAEKDTWSFIVNQFPVKFTVSVFTYVMWDNSVCCLTVKHAGAITDPQHKCLATTFGKCLCIFISGYIKIRVFKSS